MKTGKVIAILAGVITIVVGGIAIYQFVNPEPKPIVEPPVKERSFLEKATGSYTLNSWIQADRPIEIGIKILEGTMDIKSDGTMDWTLLLAQSYSSQPDRVRMTSRGRIQLSNKRVLSVQGGEFNKTHHFGGTSWIQVSKDAQLAVRGWAIGQPKDAFKVSVNEQSNGSISFEMTNTRGTYFWEQQ